MSSSVLSICVTTALLVDVLARASLLAVTGPTTFPCDDAFLDYVEHQTFNYFWNEANPSTGLVRLRTDRPNTCSVAAVGFGLSAINVGVQRGWITRAEGGARTLAALRTLYNAPQGPGVSGFAGYHGWFYHLLDLNSGLRTDTSELSSSDTTLLMSGVLDAGQFFDDPLDSQETAIRQLSAALFGRIDYPFMLKTSDNTVYQHWTPETGYSGGGYKGYNQVSYIYIYGLGTTNNPLPAASWDAWVSGCDWKTYYGFSYAYISRLFCYQYSHCFIDYRGIADTYMRGKGSDYFENSRRATLAQQAYAIDNPNGFPNYNGVEWGWTSCSGPPGYVTYGAPAGVDDGTIAPTAVAGALPFAPEVCLPALRHLYDTYTNKLWTNEGFRDAFNVSSNWFCPDALAIDEGPIVLMIENHRTGAIWRRMRNCPVVQRGLQRAGFAPVSQQALAAEPFSYDNDTPLDAHGLWYLTGTSSLGKISAGNLSCAGLTSSLGSSYSWPAGNDSVRLPVVTVTNGPVYFSFLLRVDEIGSFVGHDTFTGLALGSATTYYPKLDLVCTSSNAWQLGIYKGGGTTGNGSIAPQVFTTNDTVFVVARYWFDPTSSTNDVCAVWVNPNPATFGNASPPASTLDRVGAAITDAQAVDRITWRGSTTGVQRKTVDELRIGLTWAAVTPPGPVPLSISVGGNSATVVWPTNTGAGFVLESAPTLDSAAWSLAAGISVQETNFTATMAAPAGQRFFKLSK